MDALGIDVQVLYPTLFLRPTTARADVELAIYRGYNRWLAHIWRLGNNRLRWVVLPLFYQREPLGCLLTELCLYDGKAYESLRAHLSAALWALRRPRPPAI